MNKYIKMLLSLPKTVYVNLRLFPLKDAVKLPIGVSYNTLFNIHMGVGGGKCKGANPAYDD